MDAQENRQVMHRADYRAQLFSWWKDLQNDRLSFRSDRAARDHAAMTRRSTMSNVQTAAGRPLWQFVELGYVTNDLERALNVLRSNYGIDQWMETGTASIDLGRGRTSALRIAVAYVGRLLLEVQEPVGGEVDWYRTALPTDGGFAIRLHHLAFTADSLERLDRVRQCLVATGHSIPYEGRFGATSRYFFADARDTLGQYLEYIHFGAEVDVFEVLAQCVACIGEEIARCRAKPPFVGNRMPRRDQALTDAVETFEAIGGESKMMQSNGEAAVGRQRGAVPIDLASDRLLDFEQQTTHVGDGNPQC